MTTAEIIDRGYRRYDGPRSGVRGAVRSVWIQTMQRALGLRRSLGQKVLPTLTIVIAYLPAIVFVGITALLDTDEMREQGEFLLPTYGEYYGFIILAIMLFVAFVAPEVLCTDRRSGMLGLYLASPLNRDTYLLAKGLAVGTVLAAVTTGPPLLLLLANTLEGTGPESLTDFVDLLVKVVGSGLVVTVLYTSVSLAISSFTTRRAFASVAIILVLFLTGAIEAIIVATDAAPELYFFNLLGLPTELVARMYGDIPSSEAAFGATTWVLVVGYLGWTAGAIAILRSRYAHAAVRR